MPALAPEHVLDVLGESGVRVNHQPPVIGQLGRPEDQLHKLARGLAVGQIRSFITASPLRPTAAR